MNQNLKSKFKPQLMESFQKQTGSILNFMNKNFLSNSNEKYMKMYDWMSSGYDFVEKVVGKIKYGNSIPILRKTLMSKLQWEDNISVLYVSIGTGQDLKYIPQSINLQSLNIVGADISLGMLKKCEKNFSKKLNLTLVQCCAEDLPFQDHSFDMVFHVGGINFFNDKKLALAEMHRVAKIGSKILVADETADYIDTQYKKSFFSKKYFTQTSFDLSEIESSLPSNITDKVTELLWDKRFYCITFKKA